MKRQSDIMEMLESYKRMSRELDEAGGPGEAGDIFETVIGLEDEILAAVDLPPAQKYRSILWDGNIDEVARGLARARDEYADRPIKDPAILLINAVLDREDDPANILPMAGFSTHIYQEFMYGKLLESEGPEEADAIIEEMRKAESRLNDLGIIGLGGARKHRDLYRSLREAGMRHLDEYLLHNDALDLDESEMDGRQLCLRSIHRAARGMIDDAIRDLTRALEEMPGFGIVYYNRALLHEMKGDGAAAMDDYNDAIRLDPDDYKALCNRGILRAEWGWHDEALEDFNRAIALRPDSFPAYCNRGNLFAVMDRHEDAVDDFTKAIFLRPDEAYLYCNRGVSCYLLGRGERALEDLWKSMEMGSELAEKFIREFYPDVRIGR